MKAAIVPRYGPPDVVRLVDLPNPKPAPGEVLVRIRATTVSSGDTRVRAFNVPTFMWLPARLAIGVLKPRRKILGTEFAGTIESLGDGVTRFAPGDRVFGMASFSKPMGTHAEFLTIAADGLIEHMPESLGFDEAGLLTARHFLQKAARLNQGERAMIIGASGAVGCAAVQLAKHAGAHVTAVCSTRHIELMHALGADRVIDYSKEPYTIRNEQNKPYDIIFDTVGATTPAKCRDILAENGRFIVNVMTAKTVTQAIWSALTRSRKVILGVASETPDDLACFREMVEAGVYRSVIDRRFPLQDIAEAYRHVDTGHKQGNTVIEP